MERKSLPQRKKKTDPTSSSPNDSGKERNRSYLNTRCICPCFLQGLNLGGEGGNTIEVSKTQRSLRLWGREAPMESFPPVIWGRTQASKRSLHMAQRHGKTAVEETEARERSLRQCLNIPQPARIHKFSCAAVRGHNGQTEAWGQVKEAIRCWAFAIKNKYPGLQATKDQMGPSIPQQSILQQSQQGSRTHKTVHNSENSSPLPPT